MCATGMRKMMLCREVIYVARKLASIQVINKIESIPDADRIELAHVMGWQAIVKKGDFKAGDAVVFFEIDSLLPEEPAYEFLRKNCYNSVSKGFRIKTAKMRGCLSQGLIMPLSILDSKIGDDFVLETEMDVTQLLGVKKWERQPSYGEGAKLKGHARGSLPEEIPKTDETRIQSAVSVLSRHEGEEFVVTEKLDGTSMTVFWDQQTGLHVCSRNVDLQPDFEHKYNKTAYWDYAKRCNLEEVVRQLGDIIVLQGELIGPGIQRNHYKLEETRYRVFNMYDLENRRYLEHDVMEDAVRDFGLGSEFLVPKLGYIELENDLQGILALSKGKSVYGDMQREGIVCRGVPEARDVQLGRLSFKAINDDFLLQTGE